MRVRSLDTNGDWNYGKGQNDYKTQNAAVAQSIQTRLKSFLGDCFFDLGAGIDWFTFLSGKDRRALNLAVSAVLLNTPDVTGILQLSLTVSSSRLITIQYRVATTFSQTAGTFQYNVAA